MKTSIITVLLAFSSILTYGQIQLEHSYNFSGTLAEIDSGEYKYYVLDVPLEECRLYNEDHTLYKTIKLPVPEGYYLDGIKFLSRKTFNVDDEIELLYIYYKVDVIESQTIYTYGLKVISESGTVLLSLADGGFAELKKGSDGYKLLTYKYIFQDYYYLVYTNVYSIGGDLKATSYFPATGMKVYPNPTEDNIYIELDPASSYSKAQIMISDISGRQMIKHAVPIGSKDFSIGTGNLPSGSYVVNLVTEHGNMAGKIIEKR